MLPLSKLHTVRFLELHFDNIELMLKDLDLYYVFLRKYPRHGYVNFYFYSGLWLPGQVNDISIRTHLEFPETIWFGLVELDIIAVSVFEVISVEFDK